MNKRKIVLLILVLLMTVMSGCSTSTNLDSNPSSSSNSGSNPSPDSNENEDKVTDNYKEESKSQSTFGQQGSDIIELSAFMTMKDIISTIKGEYTLETMEEWAYFNYSTKIAYDGIEFYFYHDEPYVLSSSQPGYIYISSNRYRYNFDIPIGVSALQAIEHCEKKFDNALDWHNGGYIVDQFDYAEQLSNGQMAKTPYRLRFNYEPYEYFYKKEDVKDYVKVIGIDLFIPLD